MPRYLDQAQRRDGRFTSAAATTLARRDLGAVQVLDVHAPAGRGAPAGYADPGDALVWAFAGSGAIVTARGSHEVECDKGRLLVNHMRRVDSFRMTRDYRALSIRVKADDLHLRPRDIDRLSAASVPSSLLLPRLLGACAAQVMSGPAERDVAATAAAARALIDLARAHADAVVGRATPPEVRGRELVLRAREFIVHFAPFRSVTPHTVADHVGVSLRTLQKAFEADGTTVSEVIGAARLARARLLLREQPQLTVEAVAERTGFGSASVLSRTFRAAHGMPPGEWRAAARGANDEARTPG
ncbi:AraC family transcriptional regulator [Demequina sp. NBRC 110057]|uniref:helix-turn-helix transcriptional regulator n=1 Tax=Demequina sp. NBRC 110057 TaxID=1570346 RepID=UPI000A01357B|nr:AraC family transcriptional regulator [Demequina sp. NBRC 110057]